MDYYLLSLRFIHITTGVFWAGAVMLVAWFIMPAVKALGPDGGKFMQQFSKTRNYPVFMNIVALVNVLSGVALYDNISMHFKMVWISTPYGLTATVGGLCAIIALTYGTFFVRPAVMKIGKIGTVIQSSGKPPTPEQQSQLAGLQNFVRGGLNNVALLLLVTVIAMAIGRYMN